MKAQISSGSIKLIAENETDCLILRLSLRRYIKIYILLLKLQVNTLRGPSC